MRRDLTRIHWREREASDNEWARTESAFDIPSEYKKTLKVSML